MGGGASTATSNSKERAILPSDALKLTTNNNVTTRQRFEIEGNRETKIGGRPREVGWLDTHSVVAENSHQKNRTNGDGSSVRRSTQMGF